MVLCETAALAGMVNKYQLVRSEKSKFNKLKSKNGHYEDILYLM